MVISFYYFYFIYRWFLVISLLFYLNEVIVNEKDWNECKLNLK